ncbi:MAG: hypothetical protein ACKO96_04925 [Flammeovirgaceae bacterium]
MKTPTMCFEDEPSIPPARVVGGILAPVQVRFGGGAAALCAAEGDHAYDKLKRNYPKNTKRKRRGKND